MRFVFVSRIRALFLKVLVGLVRVKIGLTERNAISEKGKHKILKIGIDSYRIQLSVETPLMIVGILTILPQPL
jgi:hypothetical protein